MLAWALATTGVAPLLRVRWSLHLLRGVLGIAMMAAFVYALRTLPLSTAYSIFFVAPLLITALSVPFLGERVGPRRWIAIAIGLVGVLVVLRPTGAGHAQPAAGLAVLLAALVYAVSARSRCGCWRAPIQHPGDGGVADGADGARRRAAGDPGLGAAARRGRLVIVGVGVAGALGQYAITEAFRLGEAR